MSNIHAPMGWNSWDCYGTMVDEETVKKNADYMAKHLKQYGWEYIVIDMQWYEPNASGHAYNDFANLCIDEYSRLIPAENRFPSSANGQGFKPLADYIHSLGLKFGLVMMRGIPRQAAYNRYKILNSTSTAYSIIRSANICPWNTDMFGVSPYNKASFKYYQSVFMLFKEWGVDYVKYNDILESAKQTDNAEPNLIYKAARSVDENMFLSIAPGAFPLEQAEHLKQNVNSWRISDNFWDRWDFLYETFEKAALWSIHAGYNHWPDADIMPIGPILQDYDAENYGDLTDDEVKTMVTLWSLLRSPLFIGGDLTGLREDDLALVTNEDILNILKNCRHAHQMCRVKEDEDEFIVWTAAEVNGGTYFALFNLGENDICKTLSLDELEIPYDINAKELWTKQTLNAPKEFNLEVRSHGVSVWLAERI